MKLQWNILRSILRSILRKYTEKFYIMINKTPMEYTEEIYWEYTEKVCSPGLCLPQDGYTQVGNGLL